MSKLIIGLIIGFAGLVIGVNISSHSETIHPDISTPVISQPSSDFQAAIQDLQQQIQQLSNQLLIEKQYREKNLMELASLKQEVSRLKSANSSDTVPSLTESHTSSMPEQNITPVSNNANIDELQTTSAILTSIGVDPFVAENIEQRHEKREMDQLYLRNKAIREGWFGTEKYFQESRELEQTTNIIREELGDSKYDEYLYASGNFNRIQISSVISQSPAEVAGLLPGDIIHSYNNKRIFSWSDLTTMTADGKPGEMVEISVKRDGTISKLFIPRGPMGIRLESMRVDPLNG